MRDNEPLAKRDNKWSNFVSFGNLKFDK